MGTYRGMFAYGAPGGQVTVPDGVQPPEAPNPFPPKKPGLFGRGGIGRNIAGLIGDVLLQRGGMQPLYAPLMLQQQNLMERASEHQRAYQDQIDLYNYKLAHPEPVNNDTINDVNWYMQASPEERDAYRQMHPLYRVGPDGQYYPIAPASVPTAPVGNLTPITEGGAGGNVSGGFPK